MELIISLIAGALGGNGAGAAVKQLNNGTLLNSIAGIVGGGLGGSVLSMLGAPDLAGAAGDLGGLDIGQILGQVAGGAAGGGIMLTLLTVVRGVIGK